MGASSSTNSNINYPVISSSTNSTNLLTEEPSLSLVSSSVLVEGKRDNIIGGTDGTSGGILTLWKPIVSEELMKDETDEAIYISASASFDLDPYQSEKKSKKCRCICCGKKKRGRRNLTAASYDNYDDTPTEVIALGSAEDIVIIPSDVFPLGMVATLELTPSEVRAKPVKKRRKQVPEKPDKPLSLWSLIKSAIGKDLTKFPLPVNFAEPLSMLQRLAEDYEYSSVLDKASRMSDSLEQLASVAAFTVSSYASCAFRTAKPFNPLLGETYECDRTDDLGWRCIAEQVCHHPPIAALHCESAHGWVQWQQFTMKSNFRGTYLEIIPLGVAHLRFKTSENHYTWRKVSTVVRNLYIGKIYIEQEGEMDIINHTTNEKCHMKYTSGGVWSRDRSVTGKVYNSRNEPKWEINGTWDSEVKATKLDSNETRVLWRSTPLPPDAEKRYYFSVLAAQLNEPEDGVAPTDSRNRPDQRFMENGFWDEANAEKQRLEDKQREARKQRLIDGNTKLSTSSQLNTVPVKSGTGGGGNNTEDGVEQFYTPCWFARQRDPISGQAIYMYNGDYWDCKSAQNWKRCSRIYDK